MMSSMSEQQWCPSSVQVTVQQARGLRIKGKSGTNDAYAVMQVGKEKFQTSVAEKSVAPVWKEEASFDLPPLLQQHGGGGGRDTLHVHVLHRALVGPDKLLGQAVINLLQLSEDTTRNKTEWFKLLDKSGKPDKDRGEVLVDIQFMRNNMTASMFDLSGAGKSKSRLGKFKDKVRGKKKESDTMSNVVPSFAQVLTDSEEEGNGNGEVAAGKGEKKKKHKMKSLFSPKSNLQKNMSQSMSVLPGKNSSLSGSQSSGLNVDSSEGKKKFKFLKHKRSGSSDSKDSSSGQQKQGAAEQSNVCINGSHVYCEEPPLRTSRIGSNFSLASSGHGSMEDVPESSPPSVDSLRAMRQYSPWTEEEEEEVQNTQEDVGAELRREEEEKIRMEERRRKEEEEERVRRQEEELEKLAEEKRRQEEEERRRTEEESVKREEGERIRREEEERRQQEEEERVRREEERERLAGLKRRQEEEERRTEEERVRKEEEGRIRREEEKAEEERRRQEEEERVRREEEEREEKRRLEEQESRQREEERIRMEEERAEEERRRQEEEERARRQEEEGKIAGKRRLEEQERRRREEEEMIRMGEEKAEEQRRRQEEEERAGRQEEEGKIAGEWRLEEQERRRREEEERIRMEEEKAQEERRRQEEEERARRQEEEHKLAEQKIRLEEGRRIEEQKVKKEEEERIRREEERDEEERRRREEEEMMRRQEEEREEKRTLEEKERKRIEAEEKIRWEEGEKIRVEEERRKEEEEERVRRQLAEEKRILEEQERRRIEEEERKQREEEEMIRKEEETRREEEERARKEKEERLVEQKMRQQEQERRRIEEEEKMKREEEERIRREEKVEKERKEEEARKLEKEKLKREAEEQKKKKKETKLKAAGKKVSVESPAEVTSTNPFDENLSNNPIEEIPDSPVGPDSSTAKVSSARQRVQPTASSLGSQPVASDENDPTGTQRERRLAPQPPGRDQAEKQSQDGSTRHLAQINKKNKDKDVKTVSVPPQRSVQMIAPLSRSTTDTKNTQSLTQSSATKETNGAKPSKRPAPSRPRSVDEAPSSEHKTAPSSDGNVSCERGPEAKQVPIVYGLNPFDDDEDENATQAADKDDASQTQIKSSKARAPPLPAKKAATSSTLINQNTGGDHVTDDEGVTDNSVTHARDPKSEAVHVQEAPLKESQPVAVQRAAEEAGGKKEVPPVATRRLQPVKPLNPLEQQSVSVVKGEKDNKSAGILQEKTKVNDTGLKGPYSQLTQEELISLVLKQETQLSERDKKISHLEQYIDNLLVRVMEEQPSILMSLNSLKAA